MRVKNLPFLLLVLLAAMCSLRFCLRVYREEIPEIDERIRAITTFNDASAFLRDADSERVFRYVGVEKLTEPYLRFRIKDFIPSGYCLTMKIRAKPTVLKSCFMRSAMGRAEGCDIKGDTATFAVDMLDHAQFMWNNRDCYVGIGFSASSLKPGDKVELLDFKFERVR